MNETLALVALMLGAGYLSARQRWLPENAAETLHRFVIYVCLPAMVLTTVPELRFQWELLVVVVVPWLMLALASAAVLVASRIWHFSASVQAALLLCVPLGNTSFLGFPMLEALLGREAIRVGVLYDQFGSFFILTTYGFLVLARYDPRQVAPSWHAVLLRVITFPSFLALCVGLLIPHAPWLWPEVAQAIAQRLGDTLVPLAMFAVGLKLQLRAPRPRRAVIFGLSLKLVIMPLAALSLVRALSIEGLVAEVTVLQSAMPSMVSAGALAIMAGLAPELSAALVGYGIVLSLVTLPLWEALL